ncbi:TolC family protein [Paenibacillus sp. P96]|uniref:TolC family protein n=1 Tax=Paenibacillus zeirhizosphaerae TaxID=2987519 RepID=A0ABT9FW22_9BACL|nr:TolC family protein [Paenibacillus sp. P96]MDP4098932.1 TolC family protein [Paenibacillus sp. P96]
MMKEKTVALLLVVSLSAALAGEVKAASGGNQQPQPSNAEVNAPAKQGEVQLTLEQAVALAEANNDLLRSSARDLERKGISLQEAAEDLGYISPYDVDGSVDASESNPLWKSYTSANEAYLTAARHAKFAKDKVYFSVMKSYQAVYVAENNAETAQQQLELARAKERIAAAKSSRGLVAQKDYDDAVHSRTEAEEAVRQRSSELQKSYDALNTLIGKAKGTTYTLENPPEYREPVKLDIEAHISKLVEGTPEIIDLKEAVKNSEWDIRYDNFQGSDADKKLKRMDLEDANERLTKGKEDFAESLRTVYSTLMDKGQEYIRLKENYDIAQKALELSRKKLDRGMIIQSELVESRLNADQLRRQLEELVIEISQLEYTLNKPWSV